MTFQELNLKEDIQSALTKAGYQEPSPIQERAIPVMEAGRDLIACAQTGTGKTAAFALPILNRLEPEGSKRVRALILTPTRELAIQIFNNLKMYGRYLPLRSACVYGGAKQEAQIKLLRAGCDILVATPGRLLDFCAQGLISLKQVEIFVLDEADRMLDMGFIGDVRRVIRAMGTKRQNVMFSATMPPQIEDLAREILTQPVLVKVSSTTNPVETVEQKLCFTQKADKKVLLAELLAREEVKKCIVFTRTKHGADRLTRYLVKNGIQAAAIHGDKTQGQRQNALEKLRSGAIKALVATDVAARGIDIPKLSHVFNYELPTEAEAYIHRIGRAGRAGETGKALTLCCEDELELLRDIEEMMDRQIPLLETRWSVPLERLAPSARYRQSHGKKGRTETPGQRAGVHADASRRRKREHSDALGQRKEKYRFNS